VSSVEHTEHHFKAALLWISMWTHYCNSAWVQLKPDELLPLGKDLLAGKELHTLELSFKH